MKLIYLLIIGGIAIVMLNGCKKSVETKQSTEIKIEQTTTTVAMTTETTNTTTTTTSVPEPISLEVSGHTVVNRVEDFYLGDLENVLNSSDGLVLSEGVLKGTYTSPIMNTSNFKQLVASWNAITPTDTNIELKIQVRQNETWSRWFTYGKWGLGRANASISNQADDLARLSIDTVMVKNGYADGYRYMITLNRKVATDASPTLKLVAATMALENESVETIDLSQINWQTDIEVPIRSQMLVPVIGNVICSPTSLTMLMNHYGVNYTPNESANVAKDYGANIYGNWSYNVAVAGALGLESYVSRLESIDELKLLIAQNTPVAVSITVKDASQLDNLPLRTDGTSVMTYPSGHLLVVRGFTTIDSVEYVIVNDPAARNNEEVNRHYRLDQFETIWKNYVYIIKETVTN